MSALALVFNDLMRGFELNRMVEEKNSKEEEQFVRYHYYFILSLFRSSHNWILLDLHEVHLCLSHYLLSSPCVLQRSLIAHEDSVTCVRFQPDTHYFFSGGKDGVLKYWDADRCATLPQLTLFFSQTPPSLSYVMISARPVSASDDCMWKVQCCYSNYCITDLLSVSHYMPPHYEDTHRLTHTQHAHCPWCSYLIMIVSTIDVLSSRLNDVPQGHNPP